MVLKEYFQLLFPWLCLTWLVFSLGAWTKVVQPGKVLHKLVVLVLSAFITFVPFAGLSLAHVLLSFNPNFSMGSLALVIMGLAPHFHSKPLLSDRQLFGFCLGNVGISLVLYGSYFGLVAYDVYADGQHFSHWFVVLALLTMFFIWRRNPVAYIFIAYIAAFDLQLLPSPNFFDYVTDGFLFAVSLALSIAYTVKQVRLRFSS